MGKFKELSIELESLNSTHSTEKAALHKKAVDLMEKKLSKNKARILWIAVLDCKENKTNFFYMGE